MTRLQTPVDATPPASPVDGDELLDAPAIAVPSTPRRGRGKPSTAPDVGASYEQAQRFAQGKGQHHRPPGSRELPGSVNSWYSRDTFDGVKCQGQLRSVYARITAPSERYGVAGKTSWKPVAVWCDGCAAVWTKPIDPAEATRQRPGRW